MKQMYQFLFSKTLCQEWLNTSVKVYLYISLSLEIHELQSQAGGKAHQKGVTLPTGHAHITLPGSSTGSMEKYGQHTSLQGGHFLFTFLFWQLNCDHRHWIHTSLQYSLILLAHSFINADPIQPKSGFCAAGHS